MALTPEAVKTPKNSKPMASMWNLCLLFTTLLVKKIVIVSNLDIPWCLLWPLLFLILSAGLRVSALCLQLPSWCSCRQLSDGPSILCTRENSPVSLCLSLWMMPLRPLTTWVPMAAPSLVPQAPAPQMGAEWPCQGPARQGSPPSLWLLSPLLSAPVPGPFTAGLVLCQPSPARAGAVGFSFPGAQLCFPALGLMRFGLAPSLCLSFYVYVFASAAIPHGSLLFLAPSTFWSPASLLRVCSAPASWVLVSVWGSGVAPGVLPGQDAAGCSAAGCSSVIQGSGQFSRPTSLLFMELWAPQTPAESVVGDLSWKLSWNQRMFSGPFSFHQRPPQFVTSLRLSKLISSRLFPCSFQKLVGLYTFELSGIRMVGTSCGCHDALRVDNTHKTHGVIHGVSYAGPGIGLHDPDGSFPNQDILLSDESWHNVA